tara:strand:+ start:335 stop:676 length:342 start_codon:yes stop_codon:yes gene_type:complete
LNIEHFKPKVAKFGSFDGKFAQIWKFLNGQKKICSVKFVLQMFQGILIKMKHGFGRKIFLSSNTYTNLGKFAVKASEFGNLQLKNAQYSEYNFTVKEKRHQNKTWPIDRLDLY